MLALSWSDSISMIGLLTGGEIEDTMETTDSSNSR